MESDGLTRAGDTTRRCHKLSTFCYVGDAAPDPSETVGERRVVPVPSPLGLPAQLGGHMKRKAEAIFEQKNGGKQTLTQHMWALRQRGLSLRDIARDVSQATGMPVSHESVRRWMLEG